MGWWDWRLKGGAGKEQHSKDGLKKSVGKGFRIKGWVGFGWFLARGFSRFLAREVGKMGFRVARQRRKWCLWGGFSLNGFGRGMENGLGERIGVITLSDQGIDRL